MWKFTLIHSKIIKKRAIFLNLAKNPYFRYKCFSSEMKFFGAYWSPSSNHSHQISTVCNEMTAYQWYQESVQMTHLSLWYSLTFYSVQCTQKHSPIKYNTGLRNQFYAELKQKSVTIIWGMSSIKNLNGYWLTSSDILVLKIILVLVFMLLSSQNIYFI